MRVQRYQYTRDQLLSVAPTPRLGPDVITRLRSLEIGVCLPRKRRPRSKYVQTNSPRCLKVLSLNCQSVRGIASDLNDVFIKEHVDIGILTETWLKPEGDEASETQLTGSQYDLFSFPRPRGQGYGGVAFVVRKNLARYCKAKRLHFLSMEAAELRFTVGKSSTTFVCVYRLHPKKKTGVTCGKFFDEFPVLLSNYTTEKRDFHLHGDFNLHYNKPNDFYVSKLISLLDDHNLSQQVNKPTQRCGNILDWTVVRSQDSLLQFDSVKEFPTISDHYGVFSSLHLQPPAPFTQQVASRNLRGIQLDTFSNQIRSFALSVEDGDAETLVAEYDQYLGQLLDQHAPLVSRRVRDRPSAPWLTEAVREARRKQRRAERKWRKTRLTIHKQLYIQEIVNFRSVLGAAKRDYYTTKLKSCSSSKLLFNVSDSLLGKRKSTTLPTDTPMSELPQRFCDYFSTKIKNIREELDLRSPVSPTFAMFNGTPFVKFDTVSEKDVKDLIMSMPTKSCILDPLPTILTKTCLDDLVPLITTIINSSLLSGSVPSQFKQAVVTPLLKKKGLDLNTLKNYRPVSNLPFLSKVLERVVLMQLQRHITNNGLFDMFQSAYRRDHSTETAVLSVMNSLLLESDEHKVSVMALLDLSAAFDTLDHSVLLQRLEKTFGIGGTVLSWFSSYVHDRSQCVLIGNERSLPSPLLFGVPQGSVLGPVLFTLYSQSLSDVIAQHGCQYHKYADDTEIASSASPSQFSSTLAIIQDCVHDVSSWMDSNKLKLNPDKTEAIKIGVPSCLGQVDNCSIDLVDNVIQFQSCVKYLGVTLDSTLTMKDHISSVSRTCFLKLRRIASIQHFLPREAIMRLVSATILSQIDYCNSTFIGITEEQISRLQRIQNAAARLILRKRKRDHAIPLLRELHWLPVHARIEYKVAVLAFRHFDGSLAPCLSSTLKAKLLSRSLRSSQATQLIVPRYNLKTAGARAFSTAAPKIWNNLPINLRQAATLSAFKTKLKTHLFNVYLN